MRFGAAAVAVLWLAFGTACEFGDSDGGEPFAEAEALMAADRAFAEASAARGAEAWSDVWADRGLLYGDGSDPAVGPAAARRRVAAVADELRWEPVASGMLWPGELGYTVGHWWMGAAAPEAEKDRRRYLTVWRLLDGAWKVVLDLTIPEQQTSSAANAFDFWLGDWDLEQRIWSGRRGEFEPYPAENRVRMIEGGGALVESFHGVARFFWLGMDEPAPIRGMSVRLYYPDAREWRIFWIDTLDPKFGPPFTGAFSGDVGEFLLTKRPDGIPPSRIRFEREIDGVVHWQLALRTPDGKSWQPLWVIEFRRDEND
jgi:hypothetical protein